MSQVSAHPQTFPLPRPDLAAPPEEYRRWREECPLKQVTIRGGKTAWVTTTHAAAKEALTVKGTSADRLHPDFPNLRAGVVTLQPGTNILHMDGEEHLRLRRMLAPEFTAKRIKELTPRVEALVDEAVDRLLAHGAPADFHELVSQAIPSQTICLLLGLDYSAHGLFEKLTTRLLDMTTTPEQFTAAMSEIEEFLREQVERQQAVPGDGLIARLLEERVATGELTVEQLVGLSILLLIGGHETTAKMISLGMVTILGSPGGAESLRQGDPKQLNGAVEEILRLHAITDVTTPKVAVEDLTIAGCPVSAGEGIFPSVGAANHDPAVFPDPEVFDPARGSRSHLTFGAGPHTCIGQNLARVELAAVFGIVLQRIPSLRPAVPVADLEIDQTAIVPGVNRLPVAWDDDGSR